MENCRILVVEDEYIVAKDIQRLLSDIGYESINCRYGEEALNKAKEYNPIIILMDIMLAGEMSGIDAANTIREELDIPVIFLSAYSNDELIHSAKKAHPYGYIIKPFDAKILKINLDMAFARHYHDKMVKSSEERYRNIFENIQDVYFETAVNGIILELSPSIENYYHYTREELIGKNVEILYGNLKERDFFIRNLKETGRIRDYEITIKTRGGNLVPCSINAKLILDTKRNPIKIVGTIRDISERKRNEEALRKSEERFRQLAEMLPETIYESDSSGKIIYVNTAGLNSFGYTLEDIQKNFYITDFLAPEETQKAMENRQKTIDTKTLRRIEYTGIRKDKTRFPIMIHTVPIEENGQATGTRGIVVDITEQKKAQEFIAKSLKEKEMLLKEVHHRIKNNLQIISSILYLQSTYVQDQATLNTLKEAQNRVQYMALIHENFYKSENLSSIDAKKYFEELTQQLSESYVKPDQKIQIEIHCASTYLDLHTAIQCGLIVNELITNSLKYAFAGRTDGLIRVEFYHSQENEFKLIISDNGIGIPDSIDLENPKTLGLDLVRGITDSLKGQIYFESGEGCKITIVFSKKDERK